MIHLIFQAMKILQKLIFKLYENMTMKNIELAMITTYVQLKQYFATIQIDDDVLYSLYIGITLGVCIVTFLIMYPGEPIADFSESAEETALKAMKRKIYEEEEEEDDNENKQQEKKDNNNKTKKKNKRKKTKEEKDEERELKELEKKIHELTGKNSSKQKQKTISTTNLGNNNTSSSSELIDQDTLKRLEKFEQVKAKRRQEADAEAETFMNDMKQKGFKKEKLKMMMPKDLDLKELKERGQKPFILTFLNYLMPIGLVILVIYIIQRDFHISVPLVIKSYFPREAEVFEKIFTGVHKIINDVVQEMD